MSTATEPVLVTGLGIAAPNGLGTDAYWSAALAGRSGIGPVQGIDASGYPSNLAGQINDFEDEKHIPGRLLPQTDRTTRLALAAADWALADASVAAGQLPEYEMGVLTSCAQGGFAFTHNEFRKLWAKGPEYVSVYESFAWFYAANTGQISIRNGMRGPCGVVVGEQAGGLDAIGQAGRAVGKGTRLVLAGGMDSAFDPWGYLSQLAHNRVTRSAYRPFDAGADGYVPGEGGAMLVLERASSARERGVTGYGEIAGYAATFDPRPGSSRPPALRRAIEGALADAGLTAADIDVVFADASGLPAEDRIEADAIAEVFGPNAVPVTAPKALTGRLGAGGPGVDVAAALLAMRDGVIPPTHQGTEVPADYRIDLVVDGPREAAVRAALVLARGYGGFNSALLVRASQV